MEYEGWVYGKREQTEEVIRQLKQTHRQVSSDLSLTTDTTKQVNLRMQLSGLVEKITRFQKALNYGYYQPNNQGSQGVAMRNVSRRF